MLLNETSFLKNLQALRLNLLYKNQYLNTKLFFTTTKINNNANADCLNWISKFNKTSIPNLCYELQYIRSSGPGGQNVNKLNTKCSLKIVKFSKSGFDIENTRSRTQYQWIPNLILEQLLDGNEKTGFEQCDLMKLYYKPLKDCLIIQSDSQRARHLNENDCFLKLQKLFEQGFYIEKEISKENELKWEKIKKRENEKRLKEKKFKKMQKELKRN